MLMKYLASLKYDITLNGKGHRAQMRCSGDILLLVSSLDLLPLLHSLGCVTLAAIKICPTVKVLALVPKGRDISLFFW